MAPARRGRGGPALAIGGANRLWPSANYCRYRDDSVPGPQCGLPIITGEPRLVEPARSGRSAPAREAGGSQAGGGQAGGSQAGGSEAGPGRVAASWTAGPEAGRPQTGSHQTGRPQLDALDVTGQPGAAGARGLAPGTRGRSPVRAEDALFLYADTPQTPQQVGAVALLGEPPLSLADLRSGVTERSNAIPDLRRRLVLASSEWRRPEWVVDNFVDVERRVQQVTLEDAGCETLEELVSQFFSDPLDPFDSPWEMLLVRGLPSAPPLFEGPSMKPVGQHASAVVVKIHHSLGDSFTLIGALGTLLDQDGGPGRELRLNSGRLAWACSVSEPAASRATSNLFRLKVRRLYRVLGGLAGMVCSGPPPWRLGARGTPTRGRDEALQRQNAAATGSPEHGWKSLPFSTPPASGQLTGTPAPGPSGQQGSRVGPATTGLTVPAQVAGQNPERNYPDRHYPDRHYPDRHYPDRRFVGFSLQARAVTIAARRLRTNVPDLLLALIAEATCNLRAASAAPGVRTSEHMRVMVPHTVRFLQTSRPAGKSRRTGSRPAANRTAGVLLDLPVRPMAFEDRVAAVRGIHGHCLRRGDAEAAAFVLRAMNILPAWLQRRCTRAVYSGQLLGVIVSVFPGVRRKCRLFGTPVEQMYPVLALADGTDIAIGAMTWGASISVGLLGVCKPDFDPGLLALEIEKLFYQWSASRLGDSFTATA